jgi:hypothetical protein
MEIRFLRNALFSGMTSNAFKLGTVLTVGWFWVRVAGCSMLYRGSGMERIDFENILAVAGPQAGLISPPSYVKHNNDTGYYYVLRRSNVCGDEEHTLAASVKVSINADGELVKPQPNSIFEIKAQQVDGNKVQLIWYYCPIEQQSEPVHFKVYYDAGTGQIDYENPIAAIQYAGERFYSYRSEVLNTGEYWFAVRAEDTAGTENRSLARIRIQLNSAEPDTIDILSIEAI